MNKMIPSEIIHADESGNAVIGKNLKIKGTTKLIGGLDYIHQYSFSDNEGVVWHLRDYGSFSSTGNSLIDLYDYDGNYYVYGIGHYDISNQIIASIDILGFDTYAQCYESINYDGQKITVKTVAYDEDVQNKLFTHTLTLTAGTTDYVLMYNCSNNIIVDSIQSLKTLMKIISTGDSIILPVVNPTDLSTAGLQITTSLCKIGTANVTTVSDVVKPL